MRARFDNVRIKAIATIVPPKIIDIDSELHGVYKGDTKALNRIKKVIGLQTRHIADANITTSDMGEVAARKILESTNTDTAQIDALIVVTQTPDYILPATACYLHGRLKLATTCLSFDINQACAGYLYGLYTAYSLIESRAARKVLLIVGDTLSRYVNPLDSNLAPIIGDGVSATLLESSHSQNASKPKGTEFQSRGFVAGFGQNDILDSIFTESPQNIGQVKSAFFELGTQGDKFYQLIIPEGASRTPTKEIITESKVWEIGNTRTLKQLYMDGAEIFNFAVMQYPKTFESILQFSGEKSEWLDYCFFHQANRYIVDNITRTLKLEKHKVPNSTTSKYGNLSGCSVPATICDTLGALETGLDSKNKDEKQGKGYNDRNCQNSDYCVLQSPLRVHLAGFGAGLAWGNAIVSLDCGFIAHRVAVYDR